MDSIVLAKVVPALDSLRYDPRTRSVIREGSELYLNPFDQRAVRVALELRRAGETVRVVSLGPPGAIPALRETRALGVDHVRLLSGDAFAGSDVLATARALVAGIGALGRDLVLTGERTTDSETGEVGPEVAGLLGIPVVSCARAIGRGPDDRLTVEVDTPTGWARIRAPTPAVVTVGEKIAKPLRASPESIAALVDPAVEVLGPADVGIDPAWVGLAGSPTVVASVEGAAPTREPRVFDQGSPADRVRAAVEALGSLVAGPAPLPPPLPPIPRPLAPDREVAVLVTDPTGDLDPDSLGIVSEVRRSLPGYWPSALWAGPPPSEGATYRLELAGALGGYVLERAGAGFDSGTVALAVERALDLRSGLAVAVFVGTPFGREVAGQVAAHRGLGLVADGVSAAPAPDGGVLWTKPSFGGRTLATIRTTTRPGLATVPPGTFGPCLDPGTPGGLRWARLSPPPAPPRVEQEAAGQEVQPGSPVGGSEVVVAVGMGVGGPEGVARLDPTLRRWGAALTATRRVVDAGWVPRQRQVGLTGRSLAPRLAILLGVRGATNHMVGWRRARAILGVNADREAPLFQEVDVGIVGDLDEIVPELERPIARLLGR
jgi:electron transfer flavoprotein alpha subunit